MKTTLTLFSNRLIEQRGTPASVLAGFRAAVLAEFGAKSQKRY